MTQKERVYKYMQEFGSITQAEAFNDLGVYRLAARISDLRRDKIKIRSQQKAGKNRYGETVYFSEYSLIKD
jgi:hypothetical protein